MFANGFERSGKHPRMAGFSNRIAYSVNADKRLCFADAGSGGGSGKSGPVSATNNITIHVNGAGDPHAVGKTVAKQQDWVLASLVRNIGPLAQCAVDDYDYGAT